LILGRDKRLFYFFIASWPALGPIQPPIQLVLGALSPTVKQQGREAYSPPFSVEVKKSGAIPPFTICIHGIVFKYIIKYKR
jgi:hypothetical protein